MGDTSGEGVPCALSIPTQMSGLAQAPLGAFWVGYSAHFDNLSRFALTCWCHSRYERFPPGSRDRSVPVAAQVIFALRDKRSGWPYPAVAGFGRSPGVKTRYPEFHQQCRNEKTLPDYFHGLRLMWHALEREGDPPRPDDKHRLRTGRGRRPRPLCARAGYCRASAGSRIQTRTSSRAGL